MAHAGLAAMSGAWPGLGYIERDVGEAKFAPGIAFGATHEQLEAFLAEQVVIYERKIAGANVAGRKRLAPRRRDGLREAAPKQTTTIAAP
jgi:hypothetical protein